MQSKLNYIDFFYFHISTFKLLGYWKPDERMRYRKLYNVYTLVCTTVWVAFLVSQYIYIIGSFDNIDELTDVSYVAITCSMDLVKMLAIYRNMDLIKSLLDKLNQPLFQPRCHDHLLMAMSVKKFQQTLFFLGCYFGVQTYLIFSAIPFFRKDLVPLTQGWFPFDWSKNYAVVYVFQNVVILWNTFIFLNLDTFTSGLLMQVGLQCDYLCLTLRGLGRFRSFGGVLCEVPEDENEMLSTEVYSGVMSQNLNACVEHYQEIKRLCKDIETIHHTSLFILLMGGSMVICFGLFQLNMVKFGGIQFYLFLSFLLCMLMEQFMYCWFGNEIIHKSGNILASSYETPWLKCDRKFRKNLLIFMIQTRNPIGFKAAGLLLMSITVFVSVLKSSYSYFTLLKTMQENQMTE